MRARYDVAIIGSGPAGLACACLAGVAGLHVAVVEKEPEEILAAPPPDGREIALTHRSVQIFESLGVWGRISPEQIAPIKRACVRNGPSADLLSFGPERTGREALGFLVSNHVIRASLYECAKSHETIEFISGNGCTEVELGELRARISLRSGEALEAALVVAADSRFSEMRRKAGIGADMCDFGRVCIVCRMRHQRPHDSTAYEWFDTDQTMAVLPLNNRVSSIVLTMAASAAPHAMRQPADAFAADVERRFRGQWGRMELSSERYAYPLVAVYAHRFHTRRFALVGDAAVGMHPVTAHGFNFGLRGADTLVREVGKAMRAGRDIASERVLAAYDFEHRRATYPLYTATNALVGLYSDNGVLAGFARNIFLRIGNGVSPIKDYMLHKLMEIDETRSLV